MKNFISFLLLIPMVSVMFSCKKYEDGPAISLKSKKSRLTAHWNLRSLKIDGVYETIEENTTVSFEFKDDDFIYHETDINGGFTQTGKWEFANHKQDLRLTWLDPDVFTTFYTIRKLTSKELILWSEQLDENNKSHLHELHFK